MKKNYSNYIGKKYGRLTILDIVYILQNNNYERAFFVCECECTTNKNISVSDVLSGKTKSCGCLNKEITTKHGLYNTRLYRIWSSLFQRCYNIKNPLYKYYGERGISVENDWHKENENGFMNFYDWSLKNGYSDNLTIDRIDNNGNYSPYNCKWSTSKEQSANTRNNKYLTYNNETKLKSQWCKILNICEKTLDYRLLNYTNIDEIFKINNKKYQDIQSGVKGVTWDKECKKWISEIRYKGIRYYFGRFKELEDAILVRKLFEENHSEVK
jgi:hypothetical protein